MNAAECQYVGHCIQSGGLPSTGFDLLIAALIAAAFLASAVTLRRWTR